MAGRGRGFRFGAQVAGPATASWSETARRVEGAGYSTLFMPDHFGDQLAPMPALAAAAAVTTTLRVGSLVLGNDYRHPVVVAKEAATLDVLSGGRLELGLGAGWERRDYERSGIAFDLPATRVDRLEESVAVVRGLLAAEGPFSFSGRHYRVTDLENTPAPVQRPHPPILIGGGGRRVLGIAGREADIVNVNFDLRAGAIGPEVGASGTVAATQRKLAWLRAAAGERFDALELSVTVFVAAVTDQPADVAAAMGRGFGLDADEILASPHVLIGPVDALVDTLVRRRDELGFTYVVFSGGAWEDMAPVVSRLAGT